MASSLLADKPVLYESKAIFQPISSLDIDPLAKNVELPDPGVLDRNLLFASKRMLSGENILRVVDQLDLTTRWGVDRETAATRVKKAAKLEKAKEGKAFALVVREASGEDSRDLANELVGKYLERQRTLEEGRAEKALVALDKKLKVQEDRVEKRRQVLERMMRDNKKIHLNGDRAVEKKQTKEEALEDALKAGDFSGQSGIMKKSRPCLLRCVYSIRPSGFL